MIKVDRAAAAEPAALSTLFHGTTEQQRAIQAFREHIDAGGDALDFRFSYNAYTKQELKTALRELFHGKCAYCESRYAGTQPMDVEHWRPKGKVETEDEELPGYYWLASTWTNLLPSCIDCNRSRGQFDPVLNRELNLGKESQFPVKDDAYLVRRALPHEHDPEGVGGDEVPLLVNPCLDDPRDYFRYRDGLILPAQGLVGDELKKAENSIRVYALNRSDLVLDRLAGVRVIDHKVDILERLLDLAERLTARPALLGMVEDLCTLEIQSLLAMAAPERVYAAMVRQLLAEHGARLGLVDRLTPGG